jgi:hypothetical protein
MFQGWGVLAQCLEYPTHLQGISRNRGAVEGTMALKYDAGSQICSLKCIQKRMIMISLNSTRFEERFINIGGGMELDAPCVMLHPPATCHTLQPHADQ